MLNFLGQNNMTCADVAQDPSAEFTTSRRYSHSIVNAPTGYVDDRLNIDTDFTVIDFFK